MFNGCRYRILAEDELVAPLLVISRNVQCSTSEGTTECSAARDINLTEEELAAPHLSKQWALSGLSSTPKLGHQENCRVFNGHEYKYSKRMNWQPPI